MPTIDSEINIAAPLATVWALAQDVEKFADIMPDLDSVKVLEREQTSPCTERVVTEWNARIAKFNRKVKWTEEDIWNTESYSCHFFQLLGDFNEYHGEWTFEDDNGGTLMKMHIEYRFEIPLIGALVQKVVQNLLQENTDGMLRSLKTEAERRAA